MLFTVLLAFTQAFAQFPDLNQQRRPYPLPHDPAEEAAQCSSVDLRSEFALRGLPSERRQGESGWCYAFVVADLASYIQRENLSPASVARANFRAHPEAYLAGGLGMQDIYPLGGGFMNLAWQAVGAEGLCTEDSFPSEDYHAPGPVPARPGEPKPPEPYVPLSSEAIAEHFPHADLAAMLEQIQFASFRRVLQTLETSSCEPRQVRGEMRWKVRRRFEDRILEAPLDMALDEGRPVGVAIDAGFLMRAPTRQMVATPSAGHAVVIAGRRFDEASGRCQYLVRNSQGDCSQYGAGASCRDNHVWVSRQLVRLGSLALIDLRP